MAIVLNAITEAVLKGGRKEFHITTIANMLNCELANYCYIVTIGTRTICCAKQ